MSNIDKYLEWAGIDNEELIWFSKQGSGDPFKLVNIDRAVDRIRLALARKEKILLYTDSDMDGTTAHTILYWGLSSRGECSSYIPHRVNDGYGMNCKSIREAAEKGVTLIITADLGSSNLIEVLFAKSLGVDVIITDHHELPSPELENECILINPHLQPEECGFKYLCGAGIAYFLMVALGVEDSNTLNKMLVLAAVATIGDVAVLLRENHILFNCAKRVFDSVDWEIKDILFEGKTFDEDTIGWKVGPLLNSSGRLTSGYDTVNFLLAREGCRDIYKQLVALNEERKQITSSMVGLAREVVEKYDIALVVMDCPKGIRGLVASRLMNDLGRSCIVVGLDGSGSGRSKQEGVFEQLRDAGVCAGHKAAFGVFGGVEKIREAVSAVVAGKVVHKRGVLTTAEELRKISSELLPLGPFGQGKPHPQFEVDCPVRKQEWYYFLGKGMKAMKATSWGIVEEGPYILKLDVKGWTILPKQI